MTAFLVAAALLAPPEQVTRRSIDGKVTGLRIVERTLYVKRRGKAVRAYELPGLKPIAGRHAWPGHRPKVLGTLTSKRLTARCLARTKLAAVYASDTELVLREGERTLGTRLKGVAHVDFNGRWLVVHHGRKLVVFDRLRLKRNWRQVTGRVRASCRDRDEVLKP